MVAGESSANALMCQENRRRLFHSILGLGNVPEAISQGACPDTSKEELALINPVPHFLLRTANLEVYNTTTVSHLPGWSLGSIQRTWRKGGIKDSHICCLGQLPPLLVVVKKGKKLKTITVHKYTRVMAFSPVQSPQPQQTWPPFFITMCYHSLMRIAIEG